MSELPASGRRTAQFLYGALGVIAVSVMVWIDPLVAALGLAVFAGLIIVEYSYVWRAAEPDVTRPEFDMLVAEGTHGRAA